MAGSASVSPWAQQSAPPAAPVGQSPQGYGSPDAQPHGSGPAVRGPSGPGAPPLPQGRIASGVAAVPPMVTPLPPMVNGGMMNSPQIIGHSAPYPAPSGGMPPLMPPPAISHSAGMVPQMMGQGVSNSTFNQVQPAQAIPDARGAPVLVGFLVTFQNEPVGKFWPLRSGTANIGRAGVDNEAEIALLDASTSARHAILTSDPSTGMAYVEDGGSRNGTFVNEQKLQPGIQRQLQDNDRLRLGSITLVVKLLAS